MSKDFDTWNQLKKKIDSRLKETYAHPREVWWCSLGLNIGSEVDGKNENFERPVLVLRMYNKEMMLVLPFTTKPKNDRFHHQVVVSSINPKSGLIAIRLVWLKLTQARVISNQRLWRKVDVLSEDVFADIQDRFYYFT